MRSLPAPPNSASFPAPLNSVSLPEPPFKVSLPAPPVKVLSPASPVIKTAFVAVDKSMFSKLAMVSERFVSPCRPE